MRKKNPSFVQRNGSAARNHQKVFVTLLAKFLFGRDGRESVRLFLVIENMRSFVERFELFGEVLLVGEEQVLLRALRPQHVCHEGVREEVGAVRETFEQIAS